MLHKTVKVVAKRPQAVLQDLSWVLLKDRVKSRFGIVSASEATQIPWQNVCVLQDIPAPEASEYEVSVAVSLLASFVRVPDAQFFIVLTWLNLVDPVVEIIKGPVDELAPQLAHNHARNHFPELSVLRHMVPLWFVLLAVLVYLDGIVHVGRYEGKHDGEPDFKHARFVFLFFLPCCCCHCSNLFTILSIRET